MLCTLKIWSSVLVYILTLHRKTHSLTIHVKRELTHNLLTILTGSKIEFYWERNGEKNWKQKGSESYGNFSPDNLEAHTQNIFLKVSDFGLISTFFANWCNFRIVGP